MGLSSDQVSALLRHRPAVHQLCVGSWLQAYFEMGDDVLAVPLEPLGFTSEATYLARYARGIAGVSVDEGAVRQLLQSTAEAQPVIVLCVRLHIDASAEVLEEMSEARLSKARHVLSWASARDVTPVGMVVSTIQDTFFRPLPPPTLKRRFLFGVGGSETDFQQALLRTALRADRDERFAFALSLYHDALKEENAQFRIARFFNVLEALASRLKSEWPSRRAVKRLIGLPDGETVHMRFGDREYKFDAIEIAGRIRDRLFHGTPFEEHDLNAESRSSFPLFRTHPDELAAVISGYCELELNRWANGTSFGQVDDREP